MTTDSSLSVELILTSLLAEDASKRKVIRHLLDWNSLIPILGEEMKIRKKAPLAVANLNIVNIAANNQNSQN